MKSPEDFWLGLAYFALAGLAWYVLRRFERHVKPVQALPRLPAHPKPEHASRWRSWFIQIFIVVLLIGLIYGIPEYFGRRDATAVCEAIPVGTKISMDLNDLSAFRKEQKAQHSSLFAANYYPKLNGVEDGNGAIILVFLAGFPFSRAYCVLHLSAGVVESKRLMFNAEDYEYCDGAMRGVWECSSGMQK